MESSPKVPPESALAESAEPKKRGRNAGSKNIKPPAPVRRSSRGAPIVENVAEGIAQDRARTSVRIAAVNDPVVVEVKPTIPGGGVRQREVEADRQRERSVAHEAK